MIKNRRITIYSRTPQGIRRAVSLNTLSMQQTRFRTLGVKVDANGRMLDPHTKRRDWHRGLSPHPEPWM